MSVILGDCVEEMSKMEADSVDAIVTDPIPPYGLEFMGKEWDRLWNGHSGDETRSAGRTAPKFQTVTPRYGTGTESQAFHHAWATAALRVAKPGAYLLAFGGTRTFHRLACAIEDAGWIIRDVLQWNFASGFPKSKASLKPAYEPILWARKPLRMVQYQSEVEVVHHALAALIWLSLEPAKFAQSRPTDLSQVDPLCVSARVSAALEQYAGSLGTTDTFSSPGLASTSLSIVSSWSGILAALSGDGNRFTTSTRTRLTTALRTLLSCLSPVISATTIPPCGCLLNGPSSLARIAASGSSDEWESTLDTLRRSALASAIEPIAQSVAAVCAAIAADLSEDLGAGPTAPPTATTRRVADSRPIVMARKPGPLRELAIDACRIAGPMDGTWGARQASSIGYHGTEPTDYRTEKHESGRWPANVILTDPIFDGGWEGVVGGGEANGSKPYDWTRHMDGASFPVGRTESVAYADTGTYSRFFLIPKASRSDREPLVPGELEERVSYRHNADGRDMGNPKNAMGDAERRRVERGEPGIAPRRNTHPTVKPVELMRHLVRLVTPSLSGVRARRGTHPGLRRDVASVA